MSNTIKVGQVVENKMGNGSQVTVRVIELNVAGTQMARVTDARETRPDAWLIKHNRTWAAPMENLVPMAGPVSHKTGLVVLGS